MVHHSRALAVILFTDVESFTSRMQEDEAHTLALVERDFQCMTALCHRFEGRVIKSTGDGLLMCFSSAEKAVTCAVQIQAELAAIARPLPAADILKHRIGIHLGEVTFIDNDVMGSGVNLAARLQGQAPSGGVCISQAVYDVLKADLPFPIQSVGKRPIKGLKDPIDLYHVDVPESMVTAIEQTLPPFTKLPKSNRPLQRSLPFLPGAFQRVVVVGLVSAITTGLVAGARYLGLLQTVELWAFNQMMAARPAEPTDPRIIVITIDSQDRQTYGSGGQSISNEALEKLLTMVAANQPRAIGLDLYRAAPQNAAHAGVVSTFQNLPNLVGICKISDPTVGSSGIAPPKGLPPERVGFSDFLEDSDQVLRRQLLALTPDPADPCQAYYALNVILATQYLQKAGFQPNWTQDGQFQIGSVVFPKLRSRFGGYQGINATNQILINFRAQLLNPGAQITLTQVLRGNVPAGAFKDRIVLIGVTAAESEDQWQTLYAWRSVTRLPGVMVHAHMISQMLSAVQDGRSLIWAWPQWLDGLWLVGWGLVGGCLVWVGRSPLWIVLGGSVVCGLVYGICFSALLFTGGWLPLVPPILVVVGVIGWDLTYRLWQNSVSSNYPRLIH